MPYDLSGDNATISAVCITANQKKTGKFFIWETHKNRVLDALADLHEHHRDALKYSVAGNIAEGREKVIKNSANMLVITTSMVAAASYDEIESLKKAFFGSDLKSKSVILITDDPNKTSVSIKMLELDGANAIEYRRCSEEDFERTLRNYVFENMGDQITNGDVFQKTMGKALDARVDNVTRSVAPNRRNEVGGQIRASKSDKMGGPGQ